MAQRIVNKRSSKLNLSRQQVVLFQKVIFVGSQMAGIINSSECLDSPKSAIKYASEWTDLMVRLANTLL